MDITTITLNKNIKKKLDALKRYDREPFNDVIDRLVSGDNSNSSKSVDFESLSETVEILSDPKIMKSLAKSLNDLKRGKTYLIDEV